MASRGTDQMEERRNDLILLTRANIRFISLRNINGRCVLNVCSGVSEAKRLGSSLLPASSSFCSPFPEARRLLIGRANRDVTTYASDWMSLLSLPSLSIDISSPF